MRIVVVIPREEHAATAGVRIRYNRLKPELRKLGHELELRVMQDIRLGGHLGGDVFLLSKCHDIRARLLAETASAKGHQVGVDIFDDYFSQPQDSRLVHLRAWLDSMRPHIGFVLCATPAMARRLTRLMPGIAQHVLPDPFAAVAPETRKTRITRSMERVRSTGIVDVLWFGVGDNPYFSVGLEDLTAYAGHLTAFRQAGFVPRLTVLTNPRAMTQGRMEALARLPLPVELAEWSEEKEEEALARSDVAFLPVNGQPFSTAKSLNRAVSALTNGVQVLSVGFPLYEEIAPFVYRSADELARDLSQGTARLRAQTLPAFEATMRALGDPEFEASAMSRFLKDLARADKTAEKAKVRIILHGVGSDASVHKFVQRSKIFSAASPFQSYKLNYDIRFERTEDGQWSVLLNEKLVTELSPSAREALDPAIFDKGSVKFVRLPLETDAILATEGLSTAERIAVYPTVIRQVRQILRTLIPHADVIVSEAKSPYIAAPEVAHA